MSPGAERSHAVLELEDLSLTYEGPPPVAALRSTNLRFTSDSYVAITGPSGSGKSTLLNVVGLLDRPTGGRYLIGGTDVTTLDDGELAALRARWFGFIFQRFHLVPSLSAADNVKLGLMYGGVPRRRRDRLAVQALRRVGLTDRAAHRPSALSGGEQQRVAIARAIVRDQAFLLADEPTGSLDSKTAHAVLDLLEDLAAEGRGIICVTHSADVAERAFADALQQQFATLAAERTALLDEALAIAQRRAARGAADAAECAAARSAAHAAGLERAAAERERADARQALAQALGLPVPELRSPPFALPGELPFVGAAEVRATAASLAHLEVAAALAEYQRREGELRLAVAAQWPDLELGPGYEYDQGLQKFRLDLGFTLPLFHGAGAAIEAAKAARTHAAAAVAAAQIRAHDDAFAASSRLAAMPRELAAAQELVDDAAARVADVDRRVARGSADRRDAIAARLDDVAARKAFAQLQHDARRAWLACELTAQQPVGTGLLAWQHNDPEGSPWPSAPR